MSCPNFYFHCKVGSNNSISGNIGKLNIYKLGKITTSTDRRGKKLTIYKRGMAKHTPERGDMLVVVCSTVDPTAEPPPLQSGQHRLPTADPLHGELVKTTAVSLSKTNSKIQRSNIQFFFYFFQIYNSYSYYILNIFLSPYYPPNSCHSCPFDQRPHLLYIYI